MKLKAILLMLALVIIPATYGAGRTQEEEVQPVRLTLSPAPEPEPPLKYRFALDHLEQEQGNAAPLYLRAALMASMVSEERQDMMETMLEAPDEEFSVRGVRSVVSGFPIHEVETAVQRRECEWDLPLRDGPSLRLPDLHLYRDIGKALALRARAQIAGGRYEEALHTIRTGVTMARQVGCAPALINGLVGISIADRMLDQVEKLIQAPGSPNVYWALAQLPSPPVDLRTHLETEMHWLELLHPGLDDPEQARLSLEEWRQIFREIGHLTNDYNLSPTEIGLMMYAEARQHALNEGRSTEEVDAMPVLQVVAVYLVDGYQRWAQEQHKWFHVPYPRAKAGLARFREKFQEAVDEKDTMLARILLPALDRAYFQQVKLERRIAALRCVEAVRMYAANHDGRLPASLEDIRSVPAPLNPARNEPFAYHVRDGKALISAPLEPYDHPDKPISYELTIRD